MHLSYLFHLKKQKCVLVQLKCLCVYMFQPSLLSSKLMSFVRTSVFRGLCQIKSPCTTLLHFLFALMSLGAVPSITTSLCQISQMRCATADKAPYSNVSLVMRAGLNLFSCFMNMYDDLQLSCSCLCCDIEGSFSNVFKIQDVSEMEMLLLKNSSFIDSEHTLIIAENSIKCKCV